MKNWSKGLLISIFLLAACSSPKKTINSNNSIVNDGKIWAALWQQQAAEYKALCFQAYNIARLRVDETDKQRPAKPFAIITDIDETLLDNSPYDANRAVHNLDYTDKTWKQWTAKAVADTVPGAPSFLKYAASKGIEIFYITNRDEAERAATLRNLQLYGLPNADDAHLQLKQGSSSSKETRRQNVLQTHTIVLLCGDNLPDFDALYDNKPSVENRAETTRKLKQEFGSRYIVLPNPSYGDFEGALFNFNYKLTTVQRDSIIKSQLKVDE